MYLQVAVAVVLYLPCCMTGADIHEELSQPVLSLVLFLILPNDHRLFRESIDRSIDRVIYLSLYGNTLLRV